MIERWVELPGTEVDPPTYSLNLPGKVATELRASFSLPAGSIRFYRLELLVGRETQAWAQYNAAVAGAADSERKGLLSNEKYAVLLDYADKLEVPGLPEDKMAGFSALIVMLRNAQNSSQ